MIPPPSCPVRGCGGVLARLEGRYECARGHSFDLARSGRLTLLQPQDRRSATPGDSAEAVAARARSLGLGAGDELARAIVELVSEHASPGVLAVLDVGCGDGFFLAKLAEARAVAACGIDLSRDAAELAARRLKDALIVVANADRALPWPDASFDVALSITARRPAAELARVLRPGGLLVVAVPADDDLAELRHAVQGGAPESGAAGRLELLRAELRPRFEERAHRASRARLELDPGAQRDLLAATYRGARASQAAAVAALRPAAITVAHELLALTPRPGGPA